MSSSTIFSINNSSYQMNTVVDGKNSLLTKKQNNKLTSLIEKNNFLFNDVTAIKIKHNKLKVEDLSGWKSLNLGKKDQKKLNKLLKSDQKITLTKDPLSGSIADAIKRNKTPALYFYSSGGGGHKSAKDAQLEKDWSSLFESVKLEYAIHHPNEEDPRLQNPAAFISFCKEVGFVQEYDVLHDFLGKIGERCSAVWDKAQESGDVKKQEKLAGKQWLSDIVFAIPIFFATLKRLKQHGPSTIVSTQAMATPSILMAIKVYNSFYKPEGAEDAKLDLYMTDMPTNLAGHFFDALKRIHSWGGKDKLTLYAPKPKNDTDWTVLCGLDAENVVELKTNELPVRPVFLQAAENFVPQENPVIQIKLSCQKEADDLKAVLDRQGVDTELPAFAVPNQANTFNYQMQKEDEGFFLMLGSKPTKQAILDYVDRFVTMANENPNKKYHLFAFAGKYNQNPVEECFYKELCEYTKDVVGLPQNLTIVPLSFQDPSQLVPLMLQCNTITRSGGATVMELLVLDALREQLDLPEKERFVHAQFVKNRDDLESRIPVWERGNYQFLREALGKERVKATDPFHLYTEPAKIIPPKPWHHRLVSRLRPSFGS